MITNYDNQSNIPLIDQNLDQTICSNSEINQAVIVLQSYIRRQTIKCNYVTGEEIREVWQSVPALRKCDPLKQKKLSLLIARELQSNLSNSSLHGIDIHYSKTIEYKFGSGRKIKPSNTFYTYINSDSKKPLAIVSINENKKTGKIGEGGNKIIHQGHKFFIPIGIHYKPRPITYAAHTIARPKNSDFFTSTVLRANEIHRQLYEIMKSRCLPGRLAEPLILREHVIPDTEEIKEELIQEFYPNDMYKIMFREGYFSEKEGKMVKLDFLKKLSLIEEVFETISTLKELGYTHGDIKHKNVLLKEENGELHAYLNDFDWTTSGHPASVSSYCYWDMAAQKGLMSHSCDVIGAMLLTVFFLYGYEVFDTQHITFKDRFKPVERSFSRIVSPYIKKILNHLNLQIPSDSYADQDIDSLKNLARETSLTTEQFERITKLIKEAEAGLKLMKLFCGYFAKEQSWKELLIGSAVAHCGKMTAEEFKQMDIMNICINLENGHKNYIKERLITELKIDKGMLGSNLNLKTFFDRLGPLYAEGGEFYDKEELFLDIKNEYNFLSQITDTDITKEADPELYRLLSSKDPFERKRGKEIGYHFFGITASEIQQEIHHLIEAFSK